MFTRYSKIVIVWAIALHASLVVFNNLTDYNSNYWFVVHVLKMDTTFPDNLGMWRAIDASSVHHLLYWVIILVELAIAVLCWWGGARLFRAKGDALSFNKAKGIAIAGLTLGTVLWFTGFVTIGGEWFLMWQSDVWNGSQSAFRLIVVFGIALLFLTRSDDALDA
ncbi:MAG: DUF2165 domain-containing protein [Caldilineaceae bacterium]|nr:DUF2165 domain-containing protein [Caldilineaceae bacterium]MDE0339208.1 DUF2165 domain-containing protein [Caldilineaceae bacterium]